MTFEEESRDAIENVKSERDSAQDQVKLLQDSVEEKLSIITSLEKSNQQIESKLTFVSGELSQSSQDNLILQRDLESNVSSLSKIISERDFTIREMDNKVSNLNQTIEEAECLIKNKIIIIQDLEARFSNETEYIEKKTHASNLEMETLKSELKSTKTDLDLSKQDIIKLGQLVALERDRADVLESEFSINRVKLADFENCIKEYKSREIILENEIIEYSRRIDIVIAQRDELTERVNTLSESDSDNHSSLKRMNETVDQMVNLFNLDSTERETHKSK